MQLASFSQSLTMHNVTVRHAQSIHVSAEHTPDHLPHTDKVLINSPPLTANLILVGAV